MLVGHTGNCVLGKNGLEKQTHNKSHKYKVWCVGEGVEQHIQKGIKMQSATIVAADALAGLSVQPLRTKGRGSSLGFWWPGG